MPECIREETGQAIPKTYLSILPGTQDVAGKQYLCLQIMGWPPRKSMQLSRHVGSAHIHNPRFLFEKLVVPENKKKQKSHN